jgi:hypothetical protein
MPMVIDRSTESALSTLFDTAFMNRLKQYLGYDPDTPASDIPLDVEDLLRQAISTCEMEQWRFILPKKVTLYLPYEAFNEADGMVFLPFGPIVPPVSGNAIRTLSYVDKDGTTQNVTLTTIRRYEGEPIRLYCADWSSLLTNIDTCDPYPLTVMYYAGYSSYSQIPYSTISALKILCYHFNTFREAVDGSNVGLPLAYVHNRDHGLLNDRRAIKYVADDWTKVNSR